MSFKVKCVSIFSIYTGLGENIWNACYVIYQRDINITCEIFLFEYAFVNYLYGFMHNREHACTQKISFAEIFSNKVCIVCMLVTKQAFIFIFSGFLLLRSV